MSGKPEIKSSNSSQLNIFNNSIGKTVFNPSKKASIYIFISSAILA
jgi:hypothetical protein